MWRASHIGAHADHEIVSDRSSREQSNAVIRDDAKMLGHMINQRLSSSNDERTDRGHHKDVVHPTKTFAIT
jgi:hypothetical protein